jgi:Protein of unknown function (DUF3761)
MKNANLVGLIAAPLIVFALSLPAWAADSPAAAATPTTCKDGTTSAATGKGACSGHGGVQKTATKPAASADSAPAAAAAAPAAKTSASKSAPTATAGNTAPTGATAKCKDGTYSKSQHHSGTCSSHGGVAEWLTAAQ